MNFVAHTSVEHLTHTSAVHADQAHALGNWILFVFAGLSLLLLSAFAVRGVLSAGRNSDLPQGE